MWDLNTLRSVATVLGFVAFVLLVWRTWRSGRAARACAMPLPHCPLPTTRRLSKEPPVSDFFSSGWSWYIAAVTIAGLGFCLWLLLASSKTTNMADDGTTGHVWDEDLREMNNPLAALVVGPVHHHGGVCRHLPDLLSLAWATRQGTLGWSQEGQLQAEQAAAQAKVAPLVRQVHGHGGRDLGARSPRPWPSASACS